MRLILPKRHELLQWTKLQSFQGQCALCPWVANMKTPFSKWRHCRLDSATCSHPNDIHVKLISLRSRIHFAASPTSSSPSCTLVHIPKGATKLVLEINATPYHIQISLRTYTYRRHAANLHRHKTKLDCTRNKYFSISGPTLAATQQGVLKFPMAFGRTVTPFRSKASSQMQPLI